MLKFKPDDVKYGLRYLLCENHYIRILYYMNLVMDTVTLSSSNSSKEHNMIALVNGENDCYHL